MNRGVATLTVGGAAQNVGLRAKAHVGRVQHHVRLEIRISLLKDLLPKAEASSPALRMTRWSSWPRPADLRTPRHANRSIGHVPSAEYEEGRHRGPVLETAGTHRSNLQLSRGSSGRRCLASTHGVEKATGDRVLEQPRPVLAEDGGAESRVGDPEIQERFEEEPMPQPAVEGCSLLRPE